MVSNSFKGFGETLLEMFKDETEAIFKPQEGDPISLEVIFHARYQETNLSGEPFGAPDPVAWFRTGLISPAYLDKIDIKVDGGFKTYSIVAIQPDGLEMTQLNLDVAS